MTEPRTMEPATVQHFRHGLPRINAMTFKLSHSLAMRSLLLLTTSLMACQPEPKPHVDSGTPMSWWQTGRLAQCAAVAPRAVTSITDLITRLNELPRPLDVACAVASLPRPMTLVASRSITSAQPAANDQSPRLFLLTPQLVMSVVPEGEGAHLLEVGEFVTPLDTLKGEFVFPYNDVVDAGAPFAHLHFNAQVSTCGLCHRQERPHDTIEGAYVSRAFRPANRELMSFDATRALHESCDGGAASSRCELLAAVFGFGVVTAGEFPSNVELFAP